MKLILPTAVIALILVIWVWAYVGINNGLRNDVGDQLAELGHERIVVENSPASWACAKDRHVFRYRAILNGQPVSGHACAGGLFMGVAINPDGQR